MHIHFTSYKDFQADLVSELLAANHTISEGELINKNADFVVINRSSKANSDLEKEAQLLGLATGTENDFLYTFFKDKTRVVIAGKGKENVLKTVVHTFDFHNIPLSFFTENPIKGKSFRLSTHAEFVLFDGSEEINSIVDKHPKYLTYQPTLALLESVSVDTENYATFVDSITKGGILVYNEECENVMKIVQNTENPIRKIAYKTPDYEENNESFFLITDEGELPLNITQKEEVRYVEAAKWICQNMGIDAADFYEAIASM